jgi:hypothetical protein
MNVGMRLQSLPPGMQDAQEADLRAEALGIGRDLDQCCGAGVKQELEGTLWFCQMSGTSVWGKLKTRW